VPLGRASVCGPVRWGDGPPAPEGGACRHSGRTPSSVRWAVAVAAAAAGEPVTGACDLTGWQIGLVACLTRSLIASVSEMECLVPMLAHQTTGLLVPAGGDLAGGGGGGCGRAVWA
jgi:hypothetical protein